MRGREVGCGLTKVRLEPLPRGRRTQVPVGRKSAGLDLFGSGQACGAAAGAAMLPRRCYPGVWARRAISGEACSRRPRGDRGALSTGASRATQMFQPAEVPYEKARGARHRSSSDAWAGGCSRRHLRRLRRVRLLGGCERRDHSSAGAARRYRGRGRDLSTDALLSRRRRHLRVHLRVRRRLPWPLLATAWALPPFGWVRLVSGRQRRSGRQEQCLGGEQLSSGWRLWR